MNAPTQPLEEIAKALPPHCTIERSIANGGQGAVFLGKVNGKPAAIKIFSHDADPRRLNREIVALKASTCPNLVSIVHCFIASIGGKNHQIVGYEYHSGGDLVAWQGANPTPSDVQIMELGSQIGEAVEFLWQKRIVHRDIKPANIVVAADARFVLVDVGLARHIDMSNITLPGHTAGTPGYMSPEQCQGRQSLTIASDVFSLGITLYELAANAHPFGRNPIPMLAPPPRPLRTLRPDLPKDLCTLIHKMISIRPAERPVPISSHFQKLLGR